MNQQLRLAWAAGFLDGEGHFGLTRWVSRTSGRPSHQVVIDAAQVKRAPLDRLAELFGGRVRLGKNWCGPIYCWRLNGQHAYRAGVALLPYVVGKRRHVELLVEFGKGLGPKGQRIPDELFARREAIYAEFRALNQRRRAPRHAERLSEQAPQAEPLRMVR
jgi:hypothetical protein